MPVRRAATVFPEGGVLPPAHRDITLSAFTLLGRRRVLEWFLVYDSYTSTVGEYRTYPLGFTHDRLCGSRSPPCQLHRGRTRAPRHNVSRSLALDHACYDSTPALHVDAGVRIKGEEGWAVCKSTRRRGGDGHGSFCGRP